MRAWLFAFALVAFSNSAFAALITGVEWKQQYAQIGPSDHVEIWLTLTVATSSDPLYANKNDPSPYFGVDPALVPTNGFNFATQSYEPFASYTGISLGVFYFPCGNGSGFGVSCGGEYDFSSTNYGVGSNRSDYLGYYSPELILNPGESIDIYVFAFEAPEGGASVGEYMLFNAGLSLNWSGLDANGNDIIGFYDLGEACPARDASCALVRSVVPIPAAIWLFGSGLLGLGWLRRAS